VLCSKCVSVHSIFVFHTTLQGKESCPCCTRDFSDISEYKAFQNRMAELADEDTSELIRVNQAKSKEAVAMLSKLEVCD